MNNGDESGIGMKGQVLFAGPTFNQVKSSGAHLFPDLQDDDIYFYLSIRTKGDPQEAVDELQGLIEAFGLPMDALSQFGELKFQAGDGEILIGFKASDNPYLEMIQGMLVKPKFFGDGSQDITAEFSFNTGTTYSEMLDDEPVISHFLKYLSFEVKGVVHDKTRENLLNILESRKEELGPILGIFHALFFFKNVRSNFEMDSTQDMKDKVIESASEAFPMAKMSLKEVFGMVKSAGVPIDTFKPVLEFVSSKTAGEISINGVAGIGFKFTVRVPGLDSAVGAFLAD